MSDISQQLRATIDSAWREIPNGWLDIPLSEAMQAGRAALDLLDEATARAEASAREAEARLQAAYGRCETCLNLVGMTTGCEGCEEWIIESGIYEQVNDALDDAIARAEASEREARRLRAAIVEWRDAEADCDGDLTLTRDLRRDASIVALIDIADERGPVFPPAESSRREGTGAERVHRAVAVARAADSWLAWLETDGTTGHEPERERRHVVLMDAVDAYRASPTAVTPEARGGEYRGAAHIARDIREGRFPERSEPTDEDTR